MPEIELIISARARDIGGFSVGRVLPDVHRRLVGPFIFFDHMGPASFAPGSGLDVRPHPHINLATVTYLFEGEIVHKDSLGSDLAITPGAVNWMTAGSGIVHSERSSAAQRAQGSRLHGIQLWVALPLEHEEHAPMFDHYPSDVLPALELEGVQLRILAGSAFGHSAPVKTLSPLFYVEARMPAGSTLRLPSEHQERAAYVVEGELSCGEQAIPARHMAVFSTGSEPVLRAASDARVMLLGGAQLAGKRQIFWNFVSSTQERIERAKRDWKEGRFPKVPGDELEWIPLPE